MDLERRLVQLEQRSRLLQGAVAALGALLFLVLVSAQAAPEELPDLVGKTLTLRTDEGRIWLQATPLDTGGKLVLFSTDPRFGGPPTGIELQAEVEQKYIYMNDGGMMPPWVAVLREGTPGLKFHRGGAEPTALAVIGMDKVGTGAFVAFDADENVVWTGPADVQVPSGPGREAEEDDAPKDR